MSNYIFHEINNGLLRIVKSEYFVTQVIFSNSPYFQLASFKWYINFVFSLSLVFIKISKNGPKWTHFETIACKIVKSKYFLKILDQIRISGEFPLKWYMICLCYVIGSQMNGGRGALNHLPLLFCKSVYIHLIISWNWLPKDWWSWLRSCTQAFQE